MGSFSAFPIFERPYTLYLENQWASSKTDQYLSLRGKSLVPAEYLSLLSVQCQCGGSFGAFPVFDNLVFTLI